jgi:hypothetical protein
MAVVPFYRSLMSFISPSNDDHRLPWLTPSTLQVQTRPGHAASRAITPRSCGMMLGRHRMVGSKVLRDFYATCV